MEALLAVVVGFLVACFVLLGVVISILGAIAAAVLPFLIFIFLTVWVYKGIKKLLE